MANRHGPSALGLMLLAASWLWTGAAHADGFRFQATSSLALPDGPGSIQGMGEQFKVSFSNGTASHTIPIPLPPSHFTPTLQLAYESSAGNGPVGVGFTLSDSRLCRKTDAGAPRYDDAGDAFTLPGGADLVRLPREGKWWGPRYEGDFLRAQPRVSSAGDGQGWLVRMPDGHVQWYGTRESTREGPEPAAFDGTFCWLLDTEFDALGRSVSFKYLRDGGRLYASEIRYAEDTRHPRSVRFDYEPRFDALSDYRAGFRRETALRLAHLRVVVETSQKTGGDRTLATYDLTYEERWNASRLVAFTLTGENGEQLPGQRFTYATHDPRDAYEFVLRDSSTVSLSSRAFRLFDVDGDALPDVVRVNQAGQWGYRRNLLGRSFDEERPLPVASGFDGSVEGVDWSTTDVDGDGYVDLLFRSDAGPNGLIWYRNEVRSGAPAFSFQGALPQNTDTPLGEGVRLVELNGDGRPDFLHASGGAPYAYVSSVQRDADAHARAGSAVEWNWQGGDDAGSAQLDFGTPGVHLADMNGDGLPDYVQVFGTTSKVYDVKVQYCLGGPRFGDATWLEGLPAEIEGVAPEQVQFVDLNTDGLADLVVNGVRRSRYWLNQGSQRFDGPYLVEFPPPGEGASIALADLNGNGSVDFVLVDPSAGDWTVFDVMGDAPVGLLTGIDNGWGGSHSVTYDTAAQAEGRSIEAGLPWTDHCPQPLSLVSSYTAASTLGDSSRTDVLYQNPYWDADRRAFRTMAAATVLTAGDADAPGSATDYAFFTGGGDDPAGFGGLLGERREALSRDSEPIAGTPFSVVKRSLDGLLFTQSVSRYELRSLPDGRILPLQTGTLSLTAEGTSLAPRPGTWSESVRWNARPRPTEAGELDRSRVLTTQTFDEFGNVTSTSSWGYVRADGGDIVGDESFEETTYAIDRDAWQLRLPSEVKRLDGAGRVLDHTRAYYDGADYEGLALGRVEKGVLKRRERWFAEEGRWVQVDRFAHDAYGNVTTKIDALGHRVDMGYDEELHVFCVRETAFQRVGSYGANATPSSPDTLQVEAAYDLDRGVVTLFRDVNGSSSRLTYDGLGRPLAVHAADDTDDKPTRAYRYVFGPSLSYLERIDRPVSGQAATEVSRSYVDGLGRARATVTQHDGGDFVVSGLTLIGPNGLTRKSYNPFVHPTNDLLTLPSPSGVAATLFRYDPLGRTLETVLEDGASTRQQFRVGASVQYDADDTDPDSPHHDTPWTTLTDGQGRTTVKRQTLWERGALLTRDFHYGYDALGQLTTQTLPDTTQRAFRYDSLGRNVEARDPDAGLRRRDYDDIGNLVRETDAAGRRVEHAFDALGRLRFVDHREPTEATTPKRVSSFFYDVAQPGFPSNFALGHMTASRTDGYEVFYDFDRRGNSVRQFVRAEGRVYVTGALHDNLGRVRVYRHADGDEVAQTHGPGGNLTRVGDVIDLAEYNAAGVPTRVSLGNGLIVDLAYDVRDRLERYTVGLPGAAPVVDLTRHYDAASVPTETIDHVNTAGALSQTTRYAYDALYRLTEVASQAFGTVGYSYDAGNSLASQSLPANAPTGARTADMRFGSFVIGGRDALGQAAKPHQLTLAGEQSYGFDVNGHVTRINGPDGTRTLSWLADGSLRQVQLPDGRREVFSYDGLGKRFQSALFDRDARFVSSTLYLNDTEEVRRKADGSAEYVKFVTFGSERVAEARIAHDVGSPASGFQAPQVAPWAANQPQIGGTQSAPIASPDEDSSLPPSMPMGALAWPVLLALLAYALARTRSAHQNVQATLAAALLAAFIPWLGSCGRDDQGVARQEDRLWVLEGERTYYHAAWQGTAVAMTDEAGALVSRQVSTPFGVRTAEDKRDTDLRPFYFTQKERDEATGYVYFGARWYDPGVGRWLSPDPLVVWGGGGLHDQNIYAYVGNRPLTSVDSTGLEEGGWFGEFVSGVGRGFTNAAKNTGQGLYHAVTHPVDTLTSVAESAAHAVTHPVETAEAMYDGAVTTVQEVTEAVRTGDAAKLGEMGGELLFGVAASAVTSGVGGLATRGVVTVARGTRLASTTVGKRALNRLERMAGKTRGKREEHKGVDPPCKNLCFATGTLVVAQSGVIPIEDVQLGSRVTTSAEVQSSETAVDPDTWRLVVLEMPHASGDGRVVQIEMLRSLDWIESQRAEPGGVVFLGLPEEGLYATAFVTDILPCPEIEPGPGRVVLSKLRYEADDLVDIALVGSDTKLSATRRHPLFSDERGRWVEAGNLEPGEHLRGEGGLVEVESVTPRTGRHLVHNIEVESEHEYLASDLGVLGHNSEPCEIVTSGQSTAIVKYDGEFATRQILGVSRTPGGKQINFHAADRMVNPPKGRVPMSVSEVEDFIDTADSIKKIKITSEGTSVTLMNSKYPKAQIAVDGNRIITVVNPAKKK